MQTYRQIQYNVGQWSAENFGGQDTPYLRVALPGNIKRGTPRAAGQVPGAPVESTAQGFATASLGSLAPLLGMMEELGEFWEARRDNKLADVEDALADIGIYFCDYLCRENLLWPHVDATKVRGLPAGDLNISLGKLAHCTLKHHARIRGMHDRNVYGEAVREAVRGVAEDLEALAAGATPYGLLVAMNQTWNKIVSKRDWKENPGGGA